MEENRRCLSSFSSDFEKREKKIPILSNEKAILWGNVGEQEAHGSHVSIYRDGKQESSPSMIILTIHDLSCVQLTK
jgi:hypothetical protein